jgi:hypothetical protein
MEEAKETTDPTLESLSSNSTSSSSVDASRGVGVSSSVGASCGIFRVRRIFILNTEYSRFKVALIPWSLWSLLCGLQPSRDQSEKFGAVLSCVFG